MTDVIEATRQAETVAPARREQADVLKDCLAHAFYDDPVASWMLRDDARRLEQLARSFAIGVDNIYLPDGDCWTTDGVVGAALWLPPGAWHTPILRQLRLLPGMVAAYGRHILRALRWFAIVEREHPREPDHWYLAFIGVRPEWQGKGIGTALLRPTLERCDREGVPAYLEASSPRNKGCYERNGFQVTGIIDLPDGPPMWKMWREPRG